MVGQAVSPAFLTLGNFRHWLLVRIIQKRLAPEIHPKKGDRPCPRCYTEVELARIPDSQAFNFGEVAQFLISLYHPPETPHFRRRRHFNLEFRMAGASSALVQ